ncbi:uncharacterized protein PHALS_13596 [Plasmopara halstedii]|uniref:Uncharacterized protein n=1 Tax=Plasmopara halstedii TaxID=4781 RepID=A0A0P1AQ80_PLAHL|nr:uncharacterized protein PHALS_13596 [Plasmopara halstedii]CEG43399.1 hypothetical protein PHALS_13596 [Plasmopara halstedii]|eukprot:XP_024579768.1 hypothetical protein PHALS_13596 [Plasmopara halstedii]
MLLGYMEHSKIYRVLNLDTGIVKTSLSVALDKRGVSSIDRGDNTDKPNRYLQTPIDDDENMAPCVSQPTRNNDVIMDDDLVDNDERKALAVDNHIPTLSIQHASPPQTEITHDNHLLSGRYAIVFHPPIHRRHLNHSQHHVLRDVPHTQQRLQIESDATPERCIVVFEPVEEDRQRDDSDLMDVRPPKPSHK